MTRFEALVALTSAGIAAGRSPKGAVALARETFDHLREHEPEVYDAYLRRRIRDAWLSAQQTAA